MSLRKGEKAPFHIKPITGTDKDPLVVRVLAAENPDFNSALQKLVQSGQSVTLQTARRAPGDLIQTFNRVKNAVTEGQGKEGDIPLLTAKAITGTGSLQRGDTPENTNIQTDVTTITKGIQQLTSIVVAHPNDHPIDTAALQTVNNALQQDASTKTYALHRLTWDIPDSESNGFKKTVLVGLGAAATGFGLEFGIAQHTTGVVSRVADGVGLFTTGQSDDAVGAVATFKSERGGGKSIGKILKENKATFAAMGLAGLTDITFLPAAFRHEAQLGTPDIRLHPVPFIPEVHIPASPVLHTPLDFIAHESWYWPVVTGLTFALTAYAGSLTGKLSNIHRSASTIKALDNQGLLPGREGKAHTLKFGEASLLGLQENQSHPFRLGLLAGIGFSTAASLIAAFQGGLEGQAYSSTIQAAIGPLETGTAILATAGAAELAYKGYRALTDTRRLQARLKKATAARSDMHA